MSRPPIKLSLEDYGLDSPSSKIYFSGTDELNKRMCSKFGCGRELTLSESLAGKKCTEHMKEKKVDATSFIHYPNKTNAA